MKQFFQILFISILVVVLNSCSAPPFTTNIAFDSTDSCKSIIPIFFDKRNTPFVSIQCNGKSFDSELDLGAEWVPIGLPQNIIDSLNFKSEGLPKLSMNAFGSFAFNRSYSIDDVVLGNLKLKNVLCYSNSGIPSTLTNKGIIGLQFCEHFDILIDYQHKKVTFYNKNCPDSLPDLKDWIPFHFTYNKIITIKGQVPGLTKSMKIGFDNGAILNMNGKQYCILRNRSILSNSDSVHNFSIISESASIESQKNIISDLRIAYWDLPQPSSVDLLLGGDFFDKYQVFFNFKNNIMYIKRNS
jgi:hypothetical protein